MSLMGSALRIAAKDLRLELRTRDVVTAVGLFALLIVVVMSFSLPTTGEHRDTIAAGLLWMAFLFAILLGVGRALALEHEHRCIDALVVSPVPRESIFLGKTLANLAVVFAVQAVLVPVAIGLLQLSPGRGLPLLIGTVVLATVALVSLATLLSTIAVNTRTREAILPVLVVPVAIPVMIAAVQASGVALAGGTAGQASGWLVLLATSAALFVLLGLTTYRHILEE